MQEILKLQYLGRPLTRQQQARWANRLNVENETVRQGGSMNGSVRPQAKAQSPREFGRQEEHDFQEYMGGRNDYLGRTGSAPSPNRPPKPGADQMLSQRQPRRPKITNG